MGNKVSNLSTTLLFLQGGFKKQDKLKHQHLQVSFVLLVHRCSGIAPSPAAVTGPAVHTSDEQDETDSPTHQQSCQHGKEAAGVISPFPKAAGDQPDIKNPLHLYLNAYGFETAKKPRFRQQFLVEHLLRNFSSAPQHSTYKRL